MSHVSCVVSKSPDWLWRNFQSSIFLLESYSRKELLPLVVVVQIGWAGWVDDLCWELWLSSPLVTWLCWRCRNCTVYVCSSEYCHCRASPQLCTTTATTRFLQRILSLYFLIFLSLRPVSMPVNWTEQFSSIKAELLWRCWNFRQISAVAGSEIYWFW